MTPKGFWYCESCGQRVVILGDTESPARCPLCDKHTALFFTETLKAETLKAEIRPEVAASLFAQMHTLVDASTAATATDLENPS